ncbi:NAD-dependent epimerase/dehydratase family protein [Microbacterium marinilacus]|uniref:NAD-dependent epimerase/dehydratase domain-containing protein n=1 Tax=Microbacterium marinilacus TaxID=415209 RepID=A0ABP7B8X2_9MICO|nr:NAD-dependent epimerase/dehydratase family protein [Microbacterium marinilacus]MBY0687193.1 NAD-dependent epimerase/dehydratase family protein [Microbacterium marinilacus]
MTTVRRWIVGRGLLGRAVERARPDRAYAVDVPWGDPEGATTALLAGLAGFVASAAPGRLEIHWCAGRAVTSTPRERVFEEVGVFRAFLAGVAELPDDVRDRLVVSLASSVGGAYAAAGHAPFSEATPVAPASAYGEGKLAMEAALGETAASAGLRAVVARITNIYGPGQDLTKAQGLISVLARAHLTGHPASIYVPLDTLRDYVYEDDAGAIISAAAERAARTPRGTTTLKIVGSGRAVSIGALVSELQRLRRRHGAIVLGGGDARGQSSDLRVRSRVWTDLDALAGTTLPEGLHRVFVAQLRGAARR